MKIAIFIECAGGELFEKEADILVDFYNRIIKKYDLDIEVFTYKNYDGSEIVVNNNRILIPGQNDDQDPNRAWGLRLFDIMNYIYNNVDCDYVIKTNTSSVLNLKELIMFMNSGEFINNPGLYCGVLWWYDNKHSKYHELSITNGKLWIYPRYYLSEVVESFDRYKGILDECVTWHNSSFGTGPEITVPDDSVMTFICKNHNIPTYQVPMSQVVDIYNARYWHDVKSTLSTIDSADPKHAILFIVKIRVDREDRMKHEIPLLYFTTKVVENFIDI